MRRVKSVLAGVVALALSSMALAQQPGAEQYQLDGAEVTVLAHGFLSEEELLTLRLVGQNPEALSIFIPEGSGFAALAVAPDEGFVRAGMPVASASAISGLPDIGSARDAALDACNAARNGGPACQVVLEVAPR
jgi:hypothetical protein